MSKDRMLRVYTAGPISAKNAHDVLYNLGKGIKAGCRLYELGVSPWVPHFNYHISFFSKYENDVYYRADMVWLDVSDVVVMLDGWKRSKGARAEKKRADELGIPVYETWRGFVVALRRGSIKPRELVVKEG